MANNHNHNKSDKARELILEYLDSAKLMQICTSADNRPWVANVWFGHDNDLNLYFISRNDRRHSIEIKKNPNVAGSIVKPPFEGLGQRVRGITFEGTAEEVPNNKLGEAYIWYKNRYPQVEKQATLGDILGNFTMARIYKVRPSLYVLFDEVNFPEEPRQEFRP
ncbi:MAG: pyridoxamine 5'-phosphate oxidase family protein [Candidatus Micrarchaeota archaeon]|nr:pyridoxamine 5'-phosphate oxidase family protein [Candidatus Micrarchaeota archaeon]